MYGCIECGIHYCYQCYGDHNDIEILGFPGDFNKSYEVYASRTTQPYPESNIFYFCSEHTI